LKETAEVISIPLSIIFKKSFDSALVPANWKKANVVPIFKKGDRANPGNYCPVSLKSVIAKVFESILRDAIMHHFIHNKLFTNKQHGFLPRRLCST